MIAYKAKKIFTSQKEIKDSYILVNDGIVLDVIPETSLPKEVTIQDFSQYNIAPAFIDLQIYGGGGSLFNTEPTAATIQKT